MRQASGRRIKIGRQVEGIASNGSLARPISNHQLTRSRHDAQVNGNPTVECDTPIYRGRTTQHNTPSVTTCFKYATCRHAVWRASASVQSTLQPDRTHWKATGYPPRPTPGLGVRSSTVRFINILGSSFLLSACRAYTLLTVALLVALTLEVL